MVGVLSNPAAETIPGQVGVLFMQSISTSTPYASPGSYFAVHSALMKSFETDRVACHIAYNAHGIPDPTAAPPGSVVDVLRAVPGLSFRRVDFGPVGGGDSRVRFYGKAARSTVPAIRDCVRLIRYIRRNRIGIIHATNRPRESLYGLCLARMTGARCVVHLHIKYDDWLGRLSKWAIKHADGIIGVSQYVVECAHERGVSPDRTFPVHNGIDSGRWNPDAVDASGIRREFGMEADDPLLVMVAALRPWKGQATLIRALSHVVQTHPKTKVLLVGTEDLNLGSAPESFLAQLERLVCELRLGENVVFAGQRNDVPNILAAADVFTMPTFEDPCPLAILEAMAMAKPVVALRSGGTPELVADGVSGLLSPPDDVPQLAENIVTLLRDPAHAREMGAQGRRRVQEHFTLRGMAESAEGAYRALLPA